MTEASTTPPTEAPSSTNSEGAGGAAGAPGAGAGAPEAWYAKFTDEGVRTSPAIQKFESPETLAKSYLALEKRFGVDPGQRLDLPKDMNDAEAMKAVYQRLGAPETADGYKIDFDPKSNPNDADKAMLSSFKEAAHKVGMSEGQARGAMEFWMAKQAEANAAYEAQAAQQAEAGVAALKQAWGGAYDAKLAEVGRFLDKYGTPGLKETLKAGELGRNPDVALTLAKVLDGIAESGAGADGLAQGAGGERPMSPDQAKAAVRSFQADDRKMKALTSKTNPGHAAALEEWKKINMAASATA